MADISEKTSAFLDAHNIVAKDGPPYAYFETVSIAGPPKIDAERFAYQVIVGNGDSVETAEEDFLKKLKRFITPETKAIVWRCRPRIQSAENFASLRKVVQVYARAAFLTDATVLEKMVEPDAAA